MTTIKYKKNLNNNIIDVEISGHAGYSDKGKDIVCSSISSMSTIIINIIWDLYSSSVIIDINNDFIKISVKENDFGIGIYLKHLILELKELQEQFPDNVRVEEIL